jgi:putative membrane protein
MRIILKWLIMTAAILIAAYIIPGIGVAGIWTALVLAVVFGIVNITIKPLLVIITLPVNILTLGLFTFVINALLVLLVSTIVKGFTVSGFWAALLFSIVLSVVSYILNVIFRTR